MAVVTGNIFSNLAVQKKNALVIMLIVSIGWVGVGGHYDKCIAHLMERNKDDMAVVTGNIFSNLAVQKKNALVIMLIVSVGWVGVGGHYDKCIAHLMERNKDDMAVVTGNIFSNLAVQKKNALVIMLIVSIGFAVADPEGGSRGLLAHSELL